MLVTAVRSHACAAPHEGRLLSGHGCRAARGERPGAGADGGRTLCNVTCSSRRLPQCGTQALSPARSSHPRREVISSNPRLSRGNVWKYVYKYMCTHTPRESCFVLCAESFTAISLSLFFQGLQSLKILTS